VTTFEQIQRQLWDTLMDHERRVFLQLIQDELPSLTLRELGEILTSPAARSVGALPVTSLLAGAVQGVAQVVTQAPPAKTPRRAAARAGDKSVDSAAAAPSPRLRPVPTPRSPVPARDLVEDAAAAAVAAETAAPDLDARREPSAANIRSVRSEEAPPTPKRVRPEPAQLEIAPASDRSNVDVVRSAMSRTLAQHNRFDPDTLVMNALRSSGEWIRAKDLRPRVGLQPDDLRAVLNRLVKSGAIRREGEGPDTVYQALTAAAAAAAPLA